MRALIVVGLVACSAPPRPAPAPAAPPPQRDLAVPEPPPRPAAPPAQPADQDAWLVQRMRRDPVFDAPLRYGPTPREEIDIAEYELWSPCVREYVQGHATAVRRALTAAFARYTTSCDADRRVVVARPSDYRGSYVAYRGTFGQWSEVELEIVACGTTTALESITLVADRKRWTAQVTSEAMGGCLVATMPDLGSVRRALRDAVDARIATVEIDGAHDLVITEDMKRDLRAMLDALDLLSAR